MGNMLRRWFRWLLSHMPKPEPPPTQIQEDILDTLVDILAILRQTEEHNQSRHQELLQALEKPPAVVTRSMVYLKKRREKIP